MRAVSQGHNGWYYVSDDTARVVFNEVEGKHEPPTHLTAARCDNDGGAVQIPLESLTLVGLGVFGAPRGTGIRWTGDSHKFFVYLVARPALMRESVVIIVNHGGGMRAWVLGQTWDAALWQVLCATLTPEHLWDLCHTVTDAYTAGQTHGRRTAYGLFLEGRLKKRRKGGNVSVEVIALEVKSEA